MSDSSNSGLRFSSPLVQVLVLYGAVLAVLLATTLLGFFVPGLEGWQGVLIAVVFLYSPVVGARLRLVPRQVPAPVSGRRVMKSLGLGLLVSLVVLPLFALGNHFYQDLVYGRSAQLSLDRLRDWPAAWEGRPSSGTMEQEGAPLVWKEGTSLMILNPSGSREPMDLAWEASEAFRAEARLLVLREGGLMKGGLRGPGRQLLAPGSGVSIPATEISTFSIKGGMRTGPAAEPINGAEAHSRTLDWWLWILGVQLVVVAIPEEVFYRGYMQQRLKERFGPGPRVLGAGFGAAVFLTSVLFALGHLVTVPAPFRLAVFFPSLLFGWMRERSGHVAGGVLFHTLANLSMMAVMRFYW